MNYFLKRVFGGPADDANAGAEPPPASIAPGQVYSFQTQPFSEFAPPKTDRFAAIKILGVTDTQIVVAVLDGIWNAPPAAEQVQEKSIINENRFFYMGRPAVFGVNRDWWMPENDLAEFNYVCLAPVSRSELSYVGLITSYAPGSCHSTLRAADYAAEGEWRWAHDREAFTIEAERKNAKVEAERAAKHERYRSRLSKLTWEQLQSETPFERWTPSPPFPPAEFTMAARATIRDACDALKKLGPEPRRAEVRAILKKTVL